MKIIEASTLFFLFLAIFSSSSSRILTEACHSKFSIFNPDTVLASDKDIKQNNMVLDLLVKERNSMQEIVMEASRQEKQLRQVLKWQEETINTLLKKSPRTEKV